MPGKVDNTAETSMGIETNSPVVVGLTVYLGEGDINQRRKPEIRYVRGC